MVLDAALSRASWALRGALRRLLPHPWLLRARERWYGARFARLAGGFPRAAARERSREWPPGLNVVGYLRAASGVGEGARSTIRAALAGGVAVSVVDVRTGCPSPMRERLPAGVPSGERHAVNVVHVNADEVPTALVELGRGFFERHVNVAFWNWELPEFPERWAGHAAVFHEIWTPSRFVQRAVAARVDIPVRCVPFCVDLAPAPRSGAHPAAPVAGVVTFLAMLDTLSIVERKNPLAAWEAFRRATAASPVPARLVVKVLNARAGHPVLETLRAEARRTPSLVLLEAGLDRPGLTALLAGCDCFVSLHRAEGFGLPLLEAMSLGKPVIATGWSGNADFMSEDNSFPVRYRLRPLAETLGPYARGQSWAEPDLEHAAACMRRVLEDPGLRSRVGDRARREVAATHAPAAVGETVRRLLSGLA